MSNKNKISVHRFFLMAVFGLVLALLFTTQIAAARGPVFRVKDDINIVLKEPPNFFCNGEAMEAQGDALMLIHDTGAGLAVHISGAGTTMVGQDSGNLYRFNGALNEFVSAGDDGYHSVHHFTWFSPAKGQAFIATFLSHTTVNGNGEITVDFDMINGGCQ